MNANIENTEKTAVKKPRKSMRRAINEMCRSCIYDPIGGMGSWRQQVEACTSVACPLYECRPISQKTHDKEVLS